MLRADVERDAVRATLNNETYPRLDVGAAQHGGFAGGGLRSAHVFPSSVRMSRKIVPTWPSVVAKSGRSSQRAPALREPHFNALGLVRACNYGALRCATGAGRELRPVRPRDRLHEARFTKPIDERGDLCRFNPGSERPDIVLSSRSGREAQRSNLARRGRRVGLTGSLEPRSPGATTSVLPRPARPFLQADRATSLELRPSARAEML